MLIAALITLAIAKAPTSCCPTDFASFGSDPAFIASHLAPLPLTFVPAKGQMVTFKNSKGRTDRGFYVAPTAGTTKTLILIHEWWGLNAYMKRHAEELQRRLGYGVLAIDLYHGQTASDPKEAGKKMQAVKPEDAKATIQNALQALETGKLGKKPARLAVLGYCFGGGWSMQTALLGGDKIDACVIYYGMPVTDATELKRLKAPVLMQAANQDNFISPTVVDEFQAAMKQAGKSLVVKRYDAAHAFANPSNPKYDKKAATDAMNTTIAFLRKNM